jgi:hypothetical protein
MLRKATAGASASAKAVIMAVDCLFPQIAVLS